jgi:hypothetical protein
MILRITLETILAALLQTSLCVIPENGSVPLTDSTGSPQARRRKAEKKPWKPFPSAGKVGTGDSIDD